MKIYNTVSHRYNGGIYHNETNWKSFLTMRDKKCDFFKFAEKFLRGLTIYAKFVFYYTKNKSKFKPKFLEKYMLLATMK